MSDDQIYSVGEVKEKNLLLDWEIKNFSDIFEHSQTSAMIESSKFQIIVHNTQVTEWQLQLFPKGKEERFSHNVSLYIKCLSDDVDVYIKASFALVNSRKEAVNCHNLSHCLFQKNDRIKGRSQFIQHNNLFDDKQDLIPEDKLTVRLQMFLEKSGEYYERIKNGRVQDFDDFGMLYNNQKLSDVTIFVNNGQKKFYAHKHVLAKKSQVFAVMFENDMLESRNNEVNIEDVPYEAMQSMLRYIYVSAVFDIADATYLDLIKAADKYQIFHLKFFCENQIEKHLTVENSIDLLIVADQSNALTLKNKIIDFIVENAHIVTENPEFDKSMTQLHPILWCELFRKLVSKINLKSILPRVV